MKVKDIVAVLRMCEVFIYVLDRDCAEGYRVITSSGYPYQFSPLVMLSDVITVFPRGRSKIMIEIN